MSWEDDWKAHGITDKCVDVAIASRSTMVEDLWLAFEQLSRVARRKVAVTLATEFGPRTTKALGEVVSGMSFLPDYIYGLNILFKMGYHPELRYLHSDKKEDDGSIRNIQWAYISWNPKGSQSSGKTAT
ncbi:MAG: hypothetical protein FWD27_05730 [Coriobacteriia bacterium]|nr:hypothetical protein [Coriobacteriia bacterium]